MFKALFLATLLVTLLVNIFFLFATKDKPPDLPSSTYVSIGQLEGEASSVAAAAALGPGSGRQQRRLFLRSNDFYDYSGPQQLAGGALEPLPVAFEPHDNQSSFKLRQSISAAAAATRDNEHNPRLNNYQARDDNLQSPSPGSGEYPAYEQSSTPEPGRRVLRISVKSSKNHVFVSVDNNLVYESQPSRPRNTNQPAEPPEAEGRGMHVLVLNQFDGRIMSRRLFDTYSPQQDEELCLFIGMVREGRIMIFAIRDEASFRMPAQSRARRLLKQLGSAHIAKLAWRDMWAMVVRKATSLESSLRLGESRRAHFEGSEARGRNLAEGLSKSSRFSDWGPPVLIRAELELLPAPREPECQWLEEPSEPVRLRRRHFCDRVEGYGQVCQCRQPAAIAFQPEPIQNSQLNQVPIVVMASNRPFYLYRMLRSLLQAGGVNSSLITVFVDGFYEEPLLVSRLFDLRVVQRRPLGRRSARISHHYKSSLSATFSLFPEAKFAIIFEEDLDVARDALVYFNQTVELLNADPTLYCASAWNDQGYEHSVGRDPSLMYRIETMPGLGWMLSRELFKFELEPNWPSHELQHDWDMWIRTQKVRKNRECLIPDISRTFHFGSVGTNINSLFQRQYFSKHAFAAAPDDRKRPTHFNASHLGAQAYEQLIEQLVRRGQVVRRPLDGGFVNDTQYLCSFANNNNYIDNHISDQLTNHSNGKLASRPPNANEQPTSDSEGAGEKAKNNVIFIDMIDGEDFANWLKLASCWRLWDLDARGQHNSMWRLFLKGTPTLVIGVPASPYSQFKPPNLKPFNLTN